FAPFPAVGFGNDARPDAYVNVLQWIVADVLHVMIRILRDESYRRSRGILRFFADPHARLSGDHEIHLHKVGMCVRRSDTPGSIVSRTASKHFVSSRGISMV